jgi:hypothetical protein
MERNVPYPILVSAVKRCLTNLINTSGGEALLALDFDCTIIQLHTYGLWKGSAEALAAHVRPIFRAMLRVATEMNDLHVAVVTFSGQVDLIRDVLTIVLGSKVLADRIHIRGASGKWHKKLPSNVPRDGKLPHLASVLYEISPSIVIDRAVKMRVLLIDDDTKNIAFAVKSGFRAATFPEIPLHGINLKTPPEGKGIAALHRSQLCHGALLCISVECVSEFEGFQNGALVHVVTEAGVSWPEPSNQAVLSKGGSLLRDDLNSAVSSSRYRQIQSGAAIATGPNRYGRLNVPLVIHAAPPDYRLLEESVADRLLASSYSNVIRVANEHRVELLALPLLSASTFPSRTALKRSLFLAMRAIAENVYSGLKEIHLIASSRGDVELLIEVVNEAESLGSGQASPGGVYDAAALNSSEGSAAAIIEAAEALAGSFGPEGGGIIRQFLGNLESVCSTVP